MKLEKITFCPDGDEPVDFYVLEQTKIAGVNYILVTDFEDGDFDDVVRSADETEAETAADAGKEADNAAGCGCQTAEDVIAGGQKYAESINEAVEEAAADAADRAAEAAGEAAEKAAAKIRESSAVQALEAARRQWQAMGEKFSVETGDKTLDALINGFFLKQVLDGRVRARAGFYQAGGAYGFRDQLQDMLALLPYDPARVRQHILRCANRQFLSGDVMHWWHEPMTGVRTRISDDMLFLPFVTAAYVKHTGDAEILREQAQYLIDEEILAEKDDWYGPARPSGEYETLEDHCLRAFRRAWQMGTHGLLKPRLQGLADPCKKKKGGFLS